MLRTPRSRKASWYGQLSAERCSSEGDEATAGKHLSAADRGASQPLLHSPAGSFAAYGADARSFLSSYRDCDAIPEVGDATPLQTGFNILNLYVGLGLLSQPYAFAKGGWVTAGMLGVCALLFSYTGKLIVRAFGALDPLDYADCGGVTYPNLGHAVWGEAGRRFVLWVSMVEFVGATAMGLITYWQCAQGIFDDAPTQTSWERQAVFAGVLTVLALPSVCVRSLASLSIVSLLGFLTSLLIVAGMAFVWADQSEAWRDDPANAGVTKRDFVKFNTLPMSLGIILFTFSAHVCLPSFRASMENPHRDFEPTMNVSFVLIFVVNGALAVFGYLMFGEEADVLITTGISRAADAGWQRLVAKAIVGFVAFKSYCMLAPVIAIIAEQIEESSLMTAPISLNEVRALRIGVTLALALFSFATKEYLGHIEALCGGVCSMLTSLIFPTFFYHVLYRESLEDKLGQRIFLRALIVVGLLCTAGVVVSTLYDLGS
eukprot:TRINITY_DN3796_c0_g1_i1.p1 TRINITY_DN3796_c0_g1~~TRINITY_DN3796_c0_g1_i1.p1  ORF type:complete len:536 (+),score=155.69 TRINITY_DN3796_c0_g1_i1:145-1608(+)